MALITSMYDEMDKALQDKMNDNQEHLANMLDFAIQQLVEIGEDQEVYLIDDCYICKTYDQIFDCLRHWSNKRIKRKK